MTKAHSRDGLDPFSFWAIPLIASLLLETARDVHEVLPLLTAEVWAPIQHLVVTTPPRESLLTVCNFAGRIFAAVCATFTIGHRIEAITRTAATLVVMVFFGLIIVSLWVAFNTDWSFWLKAVSVLLLICLFVGFFAQVLHNPDEDHRLLFGICAAAGLWGIWITATWMLAPECR